MTIFKIYRLCQIACLTDYNDDNDDYAVGYKTNSFSVR